MDNHIICLAMLGFCGLILAENVGRLHEERVPVKDTSSVPRTRRAIFTGIKKIVDGKRATKKLLKGTLKIETPSYVTTRENYIKKGSYRTAVNDFLSVKPSHVKDIVMPNRVRGKVGTVGDVTIKVQTWVDHDVTSIIITKNVGTNKETSKYIAYERELTSWPFGRTLTDLQ